jgi:hypothetical protein
MISDRKSLSWGDWLKRRMRHVGFIRQIDCAAAVGCSENQLCRWFSLSTPPNRICKGYDAALARALKIDRQMLMRGWSEVIPEEARSISAVAEDEAPLRRKVLAIVELLGADQLREVHDHGRKLLAAVA